MGLQPVATSREKKINFQRSRLSNNFRKFQFFVKKERSVKVSYFSLFSGQK